MQKGYKVVKGLVYSNPLLLTAYRGTNLENYVNSFVPYSFALEVETTLIEYSEHKPDFLSNEFRSLLSKLQLDGYLTKYDNVNSYTNEMQFRFPKGINGLIGLFCVLEYLKTYSFFNVKSGMHLHIDFTDYHNNIRKINQKYFDKFVSNNKIELQNSTIIRNIYLNSFFDFPLYKDIYDNKESFNYLSVCQFSYLYSLFISSKIERVVKLRKKTDVFHMYLLSQLDYLNYNGNYNRRQIGLGKLNVWLNFRLDLSTAETRIINMTYDYSKLVSQIILVQDLMRKAKNFYTKTYVEVLNNEEVRGKLQALLVPQKQQVVMDYLPF